MRIEAKLEEMGLVLPEPARLPPGVRLSFVWVRARGDRVYVSGHGPLNPDGSPAGPFGKGGGRGLVRGGLRSGPADGALPAASSASWEAWTGGVVGSWSTAWSTRLRTSGGRPTSSTASRTGSCSSTASKPGCTLARPLA